MASFYILLQMDVFAIAAQSVRLLHLHVDFVYFAFCIVKNCGWILRLAVLK